METIQIDKETMGYTRRMKSYLLSNNKEWVTEYMK